MVDGNVIAGSLDEVDSAITEAAEALLQGSEFTRRPWRNTEPADVSTAATRSVDCFYGGGRLRAVKP